MADVIGHRLVERCGILRVMTCDGAHDQRGIAHSLRYRSNLIERRRKGHKPEARNPAVSWLEPNDTAQRGRLADRTASVGPERAERFISGDCCRRTATGSS